MESGMWHQKLKTLIKKKFASKVIMFEEILECKQIYFVLWEAKDIYFTKKSHGGPSFAIVEIVIEYLNSVVIANVLN